ncbi:MAG: metallophosphoesterase, partial [Planctomycetota bacterium]
MTFRFLHLADLHLDSVYGGRPETVQRLRRATQEALTRAASFALDQRLDAVLIAGDAFDDDRLGFEARGVLRRELARLAQGGVTVVYVTGNHDPGAASGRAASLALDAGSETPSLAPIHVVLDDSPRLLRVGAHGRDAREAGLVLCAGHPSVRVTENLVRAA